MTQTIITWIIIGMASIFVGRWAYRKITGKIPDCCSDEGQVDACPHCSQKARCNIINHL